jgi:predicted dehydrogenase
MADIGGGGLMDIGCYNISLSRFIFNAEPKRVVGVMDYDPKFGTDRVASAMMEFDTPSGVATSGFVCATQLNNYQRVNIIGTTGRIEIEIPFNAPPDKPCKIWLQQGSKIEESEFDICDQYTLQGDVFSQAVLNDTPVPTSLDDAVANMRVIEAIVASNKTGAWVTI